ncbi:MAG: selenite/tellurite reduction operon protein ExtJ [Thermodesulfobacteriota bacterium]
MLKKIGLMIMTALLVMGLAAAALAEDTVNGKVIKIETDKVTVMVEGALPVWIKAGKNVTAGGGAPKILGIKGKELVLRFSKAKAARIKLDSTLEMAEFTGDELQGC